MPPLTPRLRFRLWQAAVLAILLGMPAWFALLRWRRLDHSLVSIAGWVGFSLILLGVWMLLLTTPPDAIKLPLRRSRRIILTGTIWLHVCAILISHPPYLASLFACAMMLIAASVLISAFVRSGRSPWYAAILAWHPLTIVQPGAPPVSLGMMLVAIAIWSVTPRSR